MKEQNPNQSPKKKFFTVPVIIAFVVFDLVAMFFLIPVFLPSSYEVERSIEINKPTDVVYNNVADYNNYKKWNPWSRMEPTATNEITGTPKTIGHKWAWKGEEIGQGSLEIVELEENKRVKAKLVFIEPMPSEAADDISFIATANGTKVVWHNAGPLNYPMGRWFGLMMDDMLGGQFESGLNNLKELSEKN